MRLLNNLYKNDNGRRILVEGENSFSHVQTREWGGNLHKVIKLTRAKTELNNFKLICKVL